MGKRGVFAVVALLLLLSISFSLAQNDAEVEVAPEIEEALTESPEVNVIVILKESGAPIPIETPANEVLEETKQAVEEKKEEFLDNLPEQANAFGVASDDSSISNVQTYETINVVAATVTEEGLEELKNNPAVEEIILEPIFHVGMIDTVPLLNANDVHNLSVAGTKLNGTGMIACVLDSGIELNHSGFTGRLLPGYDFINSDSSPDDDMANSHGTHVSGTIAGLTPNGTGIAPAAQLIPIKTCNATGSCSASALLSGIDYCNNLTSTYNISVLSMSISDGGQYTSGTCPTFFDTGLATSNSLGIIPVMASGNDGHTGGISYPACSPYTLSVGSTTKSNAMSSFTNRGGDMLDVLAPGSSIISTIRGNTAGSLSGTSMATPHVSGLVLLMQQNEILNGRSELNLSQVRSILQQTGVPISGYQRVDAYNAIAKLNYNYTINYSAKRVSYQAGSESSALTFDSTTDFSNFAGCASLGDNFVYVNSSSCSQFNKSASIEFAGIVDSNVSPTRDGATCGSYCSNINFSGGVLTFNVSSFSNYSFEVSSNGSNSSIMNITTHYNLTGNFNGSIHLLTDNIIFDCAGYSVNAGSEPAIRADGRTNITIRNCSISGDTDILFNGTSESMVALTQGNGSLIFMNSDDNAMEDLTLRSSGLWISTDGQSTGNEFVNLTFTNDVTSVSYSNVTAPANTNVNQTNFVLNSGSVRVNGTQLSWLNTEAQITMEGLTSAGASNLFSPAAAFSQVPLIDLNDNGNFIPCPDSICNQTEFYVDRLVFTTQHFTTINSTSSFPVLINDSSTLTQNINVNGSAVTFNNNSISLDCQGFSMTGNDSGNGIGATNRNNITVRNCIIQRFNQNTLLSGTNNSLVTNVTSHNSSGSGIVNTGGINNIYSSITAFGNSSISFSVIDFTGGRNHTIQNSRINATAGNSGIRFITNSANNTVINTSIGSLNSVGLDIQNGHNNTITNTSFWANGTSSAFRITSSGTGNTLQNSNATGLVTIVGASNNTIRNSTMRRNGTSDVLTLSSNSYYNNLTDLYVFQESSGAARALFMQSDVGFNSFTNIYAHSVSTTQAAIILLSTTENNTFTNLTIVQNGTAGGLSLQTTVTNNTFIEINSTAEATSGTFPYGLRLNINSNNNTFINSTFTGTRAVSLEQSTGNSFRNVTLRSAGTERVWIQTSTDSPQNSFSNATFQTNNGSILLFRNFTAPNGTSVNSSNLNITSNRAFVNSSAVSFLNQSAIITLNNVPNEFGSSKQILVDANDNGNFVSCSTCTLLSFNGNTLIFNVTSFTSYSSSDSFPATVNQSSNLTSNITVNGNAFIINASNIVFDCQGFTLTGNGSGTGIDVTTELNVTIQNCNIVNFNRNILFSNTNYSKILNTSTSNSTQENIELSTSHNNTLNNITAQGNSTSFPTINLTRGTSNNLTNIFSSSADSSGAGAIALDTQSEHNILTNITVTGTNAAIGILIHEQSNNNTLTNITATTNGNAAIYIENSNLTSVIGGNLTSNSQPGLLLSISQNITLTNLEITSSSGIGMDLSSVQNSSFTSINVTGSGNEGLRMTGGVNRNNFTNIRATSPSNIAIRVTGSDNSFTNITTSSSSSIALLVISNSMRNNFTNTQTSSSSDSGLSISLNSNNNTFENGAFASNTLRAISLVSGVQNNSFRNITIFSNATWIHADGDSPNNSFVNTTFESNFGSIRAFSFGMSNGSSVGTNNLSITQNKAFLNSSLHSFLNVSSQIVLNSVSSGVPYVDFNDDGVFEVCNPPQCVFQSFNGSTAMFNVSSFTSYSTSSSGNVTVTLSKTDSTDPVNPGGIFTYQINYSVTNGTSFNTTIQENYPTQLVFINATPAPNVSNNVWFAQNLTENSTFQINITVQANSSVLSTTTVNNTVNISYENSTGSSFNINVTQNTTILVAFPLNVSSNTTLSGNISTNNSAFVMNTSNVTFDCNGFTVSGPGSGVAFNVTNANGVSIINCRVQNFASDILLFNSTFANVTNTTLVTPTTWLSADSTSNASLANVSFQNGQGSLTLLSPVTMPSSSNVNNVKLNVSLNRAFLNSSNLSFLNTSFRVRLDGLTLTTPDILADYEDDNIFQLCDVCTFISYNGSTLIFDVSHFTTYTSVESGVNFTITKTASPDPVTPGSQVTYTITFTVNSGFASNITVVENPPAELTFVTSTPTNVSANTWVLQNLSTGQSAQILATYSVNTSFTGSINNSINVSFQNSTNGTVTTQVNSTSTSSTGGGGTSGQGGGGGGGGSAAICPPFCQYPENRDLPVCRNNCPQQQSPVTQPAFPNFPISEGSSSELTQPKEETTEIVEQASSETPKEENVIEQKEERSALSSSFIKFGLPVILGIVILIIILSRLPRHPKDKFASSLKKNEDRIKELERQLKN